MLREVRTGVFSFLLHYSIFVHFWSCAKTKISDRNSNSFMHPLYTCRNECQAKIKLKNCLKLMQGNIFWNFSSFSKYFLSFFSLLSLNLMAEHFRKVTFNTALPTVLGHILLQIINWHPWEYVHYLPQHSSVFFTPKDCTI